MSSCISYHKPLLLIAVHSSNLSKSRKKHQTCYTSTCDPHTFRMKLILWCTNIMISHLLTVEGEENSCQHQSLCQYAKQHRLFCSETPCVNGCSLFFIVPSCTWSSWWCGHWCYWQTLCWSSGLSTSGHSGSSSGVCTTPLDTRGW